MATTVNEVFDAIDQYMQNKGKGNQYLFKKFEQLFDGRDSIFNPTNSVLKKVMSNFVDLAKVVDEANSAIKGFNVKLRILMSNLKPSAFKTLTAAADRLTKKLETYEKSFNIPKISTAQRLHNLVFPKKAYDLFERMRLDISASRSIFTRIEKILSAKSRESVVNPSGGSTNNSQSVRKTTVNLFSNNNSSGGGSGPRERGSGLLSKFISIVLTGSAAFLGIGFIKNFLSTSPTGQIILSQVKKFFSFIGNSIGDFIDSGGLSKMIDSSFEGISAVFDYMVTGMSNFFVKHEDKILKSFVDVGDSFDKHIWTPYKEGAAKAWKKNDWATLITGGLGTAAMYKLITKLPILKQIDSYLIRPLFRTLISTPLMNLFSSASKLVVPMLQGIVARLGIVGGIVAGLYITYDRLSVVNDTIQDIAETMRESHEIMQNTNNSMKTMLNKQLNKRTNRLQELDDTKKVRELSFQEKKEYAVLELEKQKIELEAKRQKINEKYQGGLKGLLYTALKHVEDMGAGESYLLKKQREEYTSINEPIANISRQLSLLTTPVRNVEDAEIIIPDKKDTHVFAKGGGPFDKALKDVNSKVETIIQTLNGGFALLAQVNAQGSTTVAQAVVATAPKPAPAPPPIIGGANPIRQHRKNTGAHIFFTE